MCFHCAWATAPLSLAPEGMSASGGAKCYKARREHTSASKICPAARSKYLKR